ncbi:sigma-70 family RNA polymerase sigma factor [Kitasatospora sp. NBC_01287]|uniref:sigma-70 family RNA polymerase sigma factor n=1 Tax=Kitasatospora sp. NBC_01287 TaxID=2903573 RepID=UPI00224CA1D8|nr:sigma-70 family RNA polymerase sigma factor [Kitasatospora sp. NBC_01287]MCX4747274.1 sigma-70 family RNA polymerase sigma factor [Kitasatospora sp. NBC_01287]
MTAPDWDQQMRSRLARGEESALGELYDQLAPLVHGLAGRILDDEQAAAQLTREVFGHLWEHPEEFDPDRRSLRSWVGELTQRRAVERLRGADLGQREIDARAADAQVQYVVAALPPPLRETLETAWLDGGTYQETARRLGISEQATKQRLRLGLQLLASELEFGS